MYVQKYFIKQICFEDENKLYSCFLLFCMIYYLHVYPNILGLNEYMKYFCTILIQVKTQNTQKYFLEISVEYGQYGKPHWFYSSKLSIFIEIFKRAQTINIPMKICIHRNYCMFYTPILIPV